ncbi:MAG: DNA repair protein RadC [Ignavibacteriae bacterium]|nr:DNA repair protein RadC [Ignavibacteriota bacterium]
MTKVVDEIIRPVLVKDEAIVAEKLRVTTEAITEPSIAFKMFKDKVTDYFKEHFIICCLDVRNRIITVEVISVGTLTSSLVHPREVFELAIKKHSASIMIAHNHPSGDCSPSEDDIKISKRIYEAGKILGIELIDHIVFTGNSYCSLKNKGLI